MICICIGEEDSLNRLLPNEKPEVKKFQSLNEAREFIPQLKDSELVLWHDGVWLNPDQVNQLKATFDTHYGAGIICGNVENSPCYVVDDIYKPLKLTKMEGRGTKAVDIVNPRLFICRATVLKELDWQGLYLGLNLRKLGYQHYVNLDIDIIKENKNAKDNNAKGASREFKVHLG